MVKHNNSDGSSNGRRRSARQDTGGQWKAAFIAVLSQCGIVETACKAAKVSHSNVYETRKKDEEFRKAWDQALLDSSVYLENVARTFASVVRRKYKFDKNGQHIMARCAVDDPECEKVVIIGRRRVGLKPYYEEVISEGLLMKLLEANNPDKFKQRVELNQADGDTPQGSENIIDRLRTASRN